MRTRPTPTSIADARLHVTHPAEGLRRAELARLGITDDLRPELQGLAARAAEVTGAAVGAVTVLLDDTQTLVASVGTETHQTPRDVSFCTHVTARQAPLVVRDAARDPYFAENPLVAADGTGFRAYCGVPITDGAGTVLAVLCVVDGCARDFDDDHVAALRQLAQTAAAVLLGAADAPTLPQLAASPQPARPALDEPLPLELDPLHAWIDAAMPTADEFDDEVARRGGRRRIRLPLRARSAARARSLQPG